MGRKRDRSSGMGLLPRMEARPWSDGKTVTYRYHPAGGKPINLGTDKLKALQAVLDMNKERDTTGTLRWVWEQYTKEKDERGRPIKSRWTKLVEGTRDDYRGAWKQIEAIFGDCHIGSITAADVARYVHVERAGAPRRADIEKSLLSRLFGHGIKLGVCLVNATIGVEPHGSEPRTEAPKEAVLAKFLGWLNEQTPQRRIIGMAAEYASLAGNRKVEFLDLVWPQIDKHAGEIRTKRAKQRGKKRGEVIEVVKIDAQLAALIARLEALRAERGAHCLYVFPNSSNGHYTASGFKTMWQKCVRAAIEAGVIQASDRFTFHDLRAFYTSKHKKTRGDLPDLHSDPGTTARIYDRNREVERRSL